MSNTIDREGALMVATTLLKTCQYTVDNRNLTCNEKSTIVEYKIKLAYAWMDLAEKFR